MGQPIISHAGDRFPKLTGSLLGMLLIALLLVGCVNSGYRGYVYERLADGGIGPTISGTEITFTREDGGYTRVARSGAEGFYAQLLPPARYVVTAFHPHYDRYSSAPGFFVVEADQIHTGNIFLHPRDGTVILLVRHADKASDDTNANLAADPTNLGVGLGRAEALGELAALLGVGAVFTTDYCRTAQTGQPGALAFGLPLNIQVIGGSQAGLGNCDPAISAAVQNLPNNLSTSAALAAHLLKEWPGGTVLVVGHSNTVPQLASALGNGSLCPTYLPWSGNDCFIPEDEYHHLFILFLPSGGGPAEVTHSAYGFLP